MKKHYIALSLIALASLTSCFDDSTTTSKPSSKDSTSVNSNESKKTNSDKHDPIVPVPDFTDDDFSYLLGDYYAKNSKVSIKTGYLTLETDTTREYTASNVKTIEMSYSKSDDESEAKTYETLMIEFSSRFNTGTDYQARF